MSRKLWSMPGWVRRSQVPTDASLVVVATPECRESPCPCGSWNVVKLCEDRQRKPIVDIPRGGRPVLISCQGRLRWRCRDCGRTWLASLQGVRPGGRVTVRMVHYVAKLAQQMTLREICLRTGLKPTLTRSLVREAFGKI